MSLWQCVVLDISFATAGVDLELNSTLGNPTSVFQLILNFGLVSTFYIALSNDIQKRLQSTWAITIYRFMEIVSLQSNYR